MALSSLFPVLLRTFGRLGRSSTQVHALGSVGKDVGGGLGGRVEGT